MGTAQHGHEHEHAWASFDGPGPAWHDPLAISTNSRIVYNYRLNLEIDGRLTRLKGRVDRLRCLIVVYFAATTIIFGALTLMAMGLM